MPAGSFLMGSPETENWRIEDEIQHEVSLSAFYIDSYETTQEDYERLMGNNPGDFAGTKLPVENISWLDAILYANAWSKEAGLTPVYTITGQSVTWDRSAAGGKVLIAFYSWSGNTRGIAREIQRQTNADLFEITLVSPYSSDYNTVLMEAQRDQHDKAHPKIAEHLENMDEYETILLGYPNWWASIPMPIASFLEEYDFSGKQIIPFCSHGGGRFGQSLTAIAKLAPNANMGEGLSVHYSGGSGLAENVSAWLERNNIRHD